MDRSRPWAARLFFPEPERSFRLERATRTAIRTVHLASMGVLLGGHAFDVAAERLVPALLWTVASGSALLLIDCYGSCHVLFQVRGLLTLAKVALVCLVPVFWEFRFAILLVVVAIGSIASHAPTRIRHYSVLTKQVMKHRRG